MTTEETQNYKLDQLADSVKDLARSVEKLGETNAGLVTEVSLLRKDYSRLPKLESEVNQIERELAGNRVLLKLLGGTLSATVLAVVAGVVKLVLK